MHKYLWYTILILIVSCSSEKPAEIDKQGPSGAGKKGAQETVQAPVSTAGVPYSVEITPLDASRKSKLSLTAKGFNLSDVKIEWLVNGSPVISSSSGQFELSDTKKGAEVQAKAIIQGEEIFSNIIQVKNAPPEIKKVKIMPEVFKAGDALYIEASGSDIDGDAVTIIYEWIKNREPAGSSKQIGIPIKRGDKISVKITPFDGEAYGKPIVLNREIKNLPPMIVDHKNFNFDGSVYTYQVKATDPDEDKLTYSLKSAPAGMTIDPKTGAIQWNVPPDVKGKTTFIVSVTDGNGGEATQSLTFEIKQ